MSTTTNKPWTADELDRLPEGWRYEIDEGELVIMSPAGKRHSRLAVRVAAILWNFVEAHNLGEVVGGEFGVYLHREPQTLRGIDAAFYSTERVKQIGGDIEGFPDVPPDLAVEVHLPDERDMQRKVQQYLAAGVRAVWVMDPRKRSLTQYRPGEPAAVIADMNAIVQEPVLPGFECRLLDLFGDK